MATARRGPAVRRKRPRDRPVSGTDGGGRSNILSAMLAKRMETRRVLSLINRKTYAEPDGGGAIDIAVAPAQAIIGELLAHVRRGDVVAVHSLRRGAAEALEGIPPWGPQDLPPGGARPTKSCCRLARGHGAPVRGPDENCREVS